MISLPCEGRGTCTVYVDPFLFHEKNLLSFHHYLCIRPSTSTSTLFIERFWFLGLQQTIIDNYYQGNNIKLFPSQIFRFFKIEPVEFVDQCEWIGGHKKINGK